MPQAKYTGRKVLRKEDPRLLTGKGLYVDDIHLPNTAHMALLRSPHAHARIRSLDTSRARALGGVLDVLTGPDIRGELNMLPSAAALPDLRIPDHYLLAVERVRYVGEPVAAVVAESPYIARDALDCIEADYDPLPVVLPALAAVRPAVVVLAHTSLSYAIGYAEEPALVDRMAKLAGCAAVTASRAILAAFAHLGVRRIALATPYSEAVEALGATYWKAAGLAVVAHRRLDGVTNIYDETEARAYALGRQIDMRDAEALLISGTGLPTAGVIQRLEDDHGKPVVTGQTAALWQALRVAGVDARVPGYGRLLAA